jgi:hypothetical protein
LLRNRVVTVTHMASPSPRSQPASKCVGPAAVVPVTQDSVRHEVLHWGHERGLAQNGGAIAAVDVASAKQLSTLQAQYDPAQEVEAQEVFITETRAHPSATVLPPKNERRQSLRIHLAGRSFAQVS